MKECSKCKVEKDLSEFSMASSAKDGLSYTCKACVRANSRRHYQENKEKYALKSKRWQENNPERRRELERRRDRKAEKSAYMRKRRKDPIFKLIDNMRRRINSVLNGTSKSTSTVNLLGCSPQEFRDHIENQFTEGMTWDNYGLHGWHMDHITPLSIFNMNNPAEQSIAFHYMNYQPLWALDNIKKGDKVS